MGRIRIRRDEPPKAQPDIKLDAAGRVEITHVHCEEELVWSNKYQTVEVGDERQPTDGNFTGFGDEVAADETGDVDGPAEKRDDVVV